jgi:hypothetical protein
LKPIGTFFSGDRDGFIGVSGYARIFSSNRVDFATSRSTYSLGAG